MTSAEYTVWQALSTISERPGITGTSHPYTAVAFTARTHLSRRRRRCSRIRSRRSPRRQLDRLTCRDDEPVAAVVRDHVPCSRRTPPTVTPVALSINMPLAWLPRPPLPSSVVPIRLPRIWAPVAPAPRMRTPFPEQPRSRVLVQHETDERNRQRESPRTSLSGGFRRHSYRQRP